MRNDWSGQSFPHPPGRKPYIGDIAGSQRSAPLQTILEAGAELGPIFEFKVFAQRFVFVTSAELAAELCDESRFCKTLSPALVGLRDFAGDGLFTAYNEEPNWRLAHDLLMPAFTKQAMQAYHPLMLETTRELTRKWDALAAAGDEADVSADMTRLTLETISRAAFGRDFGSFTREEPHPFVLAMVAALKTGQRKGVLATMPGVRLLVRRLEKRNASHQEYIDGLLDELIAERRASTEPHRTDLLGIMLDQSHPETGEKLDDLNIRRQILTFLVAGHETTSGALSFALYFLSRNPDCLLRAQEEVDALLGPGGEPTFEQVPHFRYLRRVLDEALRLWPTAPAFTRRPRQTLRLSTGHLMTPDDWAIVLLPKVHRDPAVWGVDAGSFDPDRFARGMRGQVYKPFGTGERACIGRQFALHEAILVLASVLHRYDLTGDVHYELAIDERLTLMPREFSLGLSRRQPATVGAGVVAAD